MDPKTMYETSWQHQRRREEDNRRPRDGVPDYAARSAQIDMRWSPR